MTKITQGGAANEAAPPVETQEPEPLDAGQLMEIFGAPTDIVHEHTLEFKGQTVKHFIKQLSVKEATTVDCKKYRFDEMGRPIQDAAYNELAQTANVLHACVVKNVGTPDKPTWIPLWTMQQIEGESARDLEYNSDGTPKGEPKKGLLDHPDADVKRYLDALTGLCWGHNPRLNPFDQIKAMKMLGLNT